VNDNQQHLVKQFIDGTARLPILGFFRHSTSQAILFQMNTHPSVSVFVHDTMARFIALLSVEEVGGLCDTLARAIDTAGQDIRFNTGGPAQLLHSGSNVVHEAIAQRVVPTHKSKLLNWFSSMRTPSTPGEILSVLLQNNRHMFFAAVLLMTYPLLEIKSPEAGESVKSLH
jgi:hypothetical protein